MYHAGSRALQDEFDSRRLADRLAEKLLRTRFTDEDRTFIEARAMFFLATADAEGFPDCSYKGGAPGLVRVRAHHIFPNCPRYIHRMQLVEPSAYVPASGIEPPEPAWKSFPDFRDVLPRREPESSR
jgi:hypothetical protein